MSEHSQQQLADAIRRAERAEHLMRASTRFWVRAAKAALAGDMRELRNRVELCEAEPMDIVLSTLTQP